MSTLVNSTSHALTLSKHYKFSFFWRIRPMCRYKTCFSICLQEPHTTQWGWWQRKAVSTAFDCSSDIFPSDSVTFLRAYQLLVTRAYTKLSTSWYHPTACFWWAPQELPFQSTSFLLTQIRPCLTPATLACLTLHPIILHNISKAFLWRLPL